MKSDYSVFNFTNIELSDLAKDYISSKLKRDFIVEEINTKRKNNIDIVEMTLDVVDEKSRNYQFIFYFSTFSFDCIAVKHLKEVSDDNPEAMRLLLTHYLHKFDFAYVEDFRKFHGRRLEKLHKIKLNESANFIELQAEKADYVKKLKKLDEICEEVLVKDSSKARKC